ncbi:MAG: rhodanese-like domain-containing protein [Woeseiaceae bacterium]
MKKSLKATLLSLSVASVAACAPSGDTAPSMLAIAQSAARQDDRASVEELATWLIEGRSDFMLIDVRAPEDYESGKIGEAENIPIAQIVSADTLARLPTDRMLLVYSNGSENAAKAAVLLRLAGFDAHLLVGGYAAWHERILNPDISAEALDGESLRVAEQRAYSCYFVGERSDAAQFQRSDSSEVFVPPVIEEMDEFEDLPPPPAEGC